MATVLTNLGEEWAAARLVGTGTLYLGAAQPTYYLGWGSGTATAAKTGTVMGAEINAASARVAGTPTLSGTGTAAKLQFLGTLTAGGAIGVTEAALFTNNTANAPMIVWGDFSVINLAQNDQITFTITIDPQ